MIRVKKYRFFRPRVYHCVWIILLWVSPVRSQQLLGLVLDNEAAPIAQVQIFNQIEEEIERWAKGMIEDDMWSPTTQSGDPWEAAEDIFMEAE
ncbi:MAG: hypothetical protein ACPGAK_01035, partial [Bacteroidia bacterium]